MADENEGRVSSLLASAGTHKPTLSVLIRNVDLSSPRAGAHSGSNGAGGASLEGIDELPLVEPLSHEQFEGADWNVNDFLLSKRHVPLDDLKSELRAYLGQLKASLVGVINDEYETFISLSLGLKQANVAQSLASIKRPVLGLRQQVSKVKDELDQKRREVEALLDKKSDIRKETAALKRLLEVDSLATKIEGLLSLSSLENGSADTAAASSSQAPSMNGSGIIATNRATNEESNAKRLDRIANEYKQLVYLFSKAMKCPFLDSIEPVSHFVRESMLQVTYQEPVQRITSLGDTLRRELQNALKEAVMDENDHSEDILLLLRTFAVLGAHEAAEATLRTSLVSPFVVRTIRADSLSNKDADAAVTKQPSTPLNAPDAYDQAPKGSVAMALTSLYNEILAFVEQKVQPILELADRAKRASRPTASSTLTDGNSYEIVSRILFPEIASRLTSELGSTLFSAGRPAVFYENYILTRQLIDRLEATFTDRAALERLRTSDSYTNFVRRFQLPVYFQLRFKEIVTNVERSFESSSASSATETYLMPETEAIWRALRTCWRQGVFLDELVARFWRLTLQLLVRYRTWAHKAAPKASTSTIASSSSNSNLAALANQSSKASADMRSSARLNAPSTGGGTGSRPGTPLNEEQQDEQTLRQCSVLTSDIVSFKKHVLLLWDERIRPLLPASLPGEAEGGDEQDGDSPSPRRVLLDSLDSLCSILPSLSDQVVSILVKRATKPLKSAGTVASQVRASSTRSTASPSSTNGLEVSYFVPAILKDVKSYESGIGRFVDEQTRLDWKARVLEDVLGRYATILQSQKKAQDSLSWLKRGRQGLSFFSRSTTPSAEDQQQQQNSGGATGQGEEDRFAAQMEVDIKALAEDARSIGVDVDSLEGWKTLSSTVHDTSLSSLAK